eukprot:15439273-Alexandrium_andersonii.AAC.1
MSDSAPQVRPHAREVGARPEGHPASAPPAPPMALLASPTYPAPRLQGPAAAAQRALLPLRGSST